MGASVWSRARTPCGLATVCAAGLLGDPLLVVGSFAGREIWNFQSGGRLQHAGSGKCAGVAGAAKVGSEVVELGCEGASPWVATPDGQLKLGDLCLSGSGTAAGLEDVASNAAASASSTFDAATHGAWAAVDGSRATYWASKAGEAGPVELTVDFGAVHSVAKLHIAWVFPAKSFAVLVSSNGHQWEELFSTAVNVASSNVLHAEGHVFSKLRVVMREAWPTPAASGVYGIKALRATAARALPALDDCTAAAKSPDARDKCFLVSVGGYDPAGLHALKAELPALEAAAFSLSQAVGELAEVAPKLATCRRAAAPPSFFAAAPSVGPGPGQLAQWRGLSHVAAVAAEPGELLARAREFIVAVRGQLTS